MSACLLRIMDRHQQIAHTQQENAARERELEEERATVSEAGAALTKKFQAIDRELCQYQLREKKSKETLVTEQGKLSRSRQQTQKQIADLRSAHLQHMHKRKRVEQEIQTLQGKLDHRLERYTIGLEAITQGEYPLSHRPTMVASPQREYPPIPTSPPHQLIAFS
ncbi:hypothetical protein PAPYR_8292 [Paratrimastix pyriformis]|uniref:Uncharacterized protein n=1 Tax=Paratrimastix pyriformis TaxID=342808 RepID=A0ABQ8UF24_9EUKA|nr:hypothetical protein PAPYR_8292 [Paratrimastix pyriformis]